MCLLRLGRREVDLTRHTLLVHRPIFSTLTTGRTQLSTRIQVQFYSDIGKDFPQCGAYFPQFDRGGAALSLRAGWYSVFRSIIVAEKCL
jgi:hypothetical protein